MIYIIISLKLISYLKFLTNKIVKKKFAENLYELDMTFPIWDRVFTVSPLVVIGTKEIDGYNLAPKHMATPVGFDNYFGFVCTPNHGTYKNIRRNGTFTVSYPKPDQIILTSISASSRCCDMTKSKSVVEAIPTKRAQTIDALFIKDSYLLLECSVFKIIDGFNKNSLIIGQVNKASADKNYLIQSEKDMQRQFKENPLLAYISYGRFASIKETFDFPFPKKFKR